MNATNKRYVIVFIDGQESSRKSCFKSYQTALAYADSIYEAKPWARIEIYWDDFQLIMQTIKDQKIMSGY